MSCSKFLVNYPNSIFIETGSNAGDGIANALKFGFKTIYSIEIDEQRYRNCVNRFANIGAHKNISVNLYCGDSSECLPKIMELIKEPATILLDAHIMNFNEVHTAEIIPVKSEIRIVLEHGKKHGIKHTILIDDSKYFNGKTATFNNINRKELELLALSINKDIKVTYAGRFILIQ